MRLMLIKIMPWGFQRRRIGFKSKKQKSLFLIWDEVWEDGDIVYAYIIWDSYRVIGF